MMQEKTLIAIVGIAGVTAIEITALFCNKDGAILGVVTSTISLIIGYYFGAVKGGKK